MVQSAADLQQIKGVGSILAKRLYDAGYDSFQKIAEGGEEGLRNVRGIPPRSVASILEQARQLAEASRPEKGEKDEALKKQLAEVREKIESLARSTRDRFQEELSGKCGKKLTSDLVRIEDAFGQISGGGRKRSKRAEKALRKAEKRVDGLGDAGLKKIRKNLKRVRKSMQKAI